MPPANLPYPISGSCSVTSLRISVCWQPAWRPSIRASWRAWVRAEPTGAYSRRIWFFYETFTGRTLNLEDVRSGSYVDALDAARHVTGERRRSQRHRVADNLLGGPGLCPFVRRTPRLAERMRARMDAEAHALVRRYDPLVLARAISYLYTKETRSSFAIEGETPTAGRTERFISALKAAPAFDPTDKAALVRLQRTIVDPRYAAVDWRDFQSFVGMTVGGYREQVDFICPRPGDVPELMRSWTVLTRRMLESEVHPVVAAAVCAFSFVFIHPFEDGNGRIHRFLMHSILTKRGYTPPGVIFPLSAAILRDQRSYDEMLESFSRPLFDFIDWRWTPERKIVVRNDTDRLYRYFDATACAEYLFDRVADTVRHDLDEELSFIAVFDRAFRSGTRDRRHAGPPRIASGTSVHAERGDSCRPGSENSFASCTPKKSRRWRRPFRMQWKAQSTKKAATRKWRYGTIRLCRDHRNGSQGG